nr:MAG TPA: hypothetical protein [Caudoviricetes sp.]
MRLFILLKNCPNFVDDAKSYTVSSPDVKRDSIRDVITGGCWNE